MIRLFACVAASAILFASPWAAEGQQQDAADVIAPLVDDQTLVVMRIDLDRFDPAGWSPTLGTLLARMKQPVPDGATLLKPLRDAGASVLYVVVSLADFPEQMPLLAVPLERDRIPNELYKSLSETVHAFGQILAPAGSTGVGSDVGVKRVEKLAVAVRKRRLDRLATLDPTKRPAFSPAFAAVDGAALQIVVAPSPDQRRVLREMVPDVASQVDGLPLEPLARGIVWMAIGLDGPPDRSMKVIMQCERPQMATDAVDALKVVYRRIAEDPKLGRMFHRQALDGLLPEVRGDQMVIELSEENGRLEQWEQAVFSPALAAARQSADRARAMYQLKQFGIAMQNMAFVNDKTFPDTANRDANGKPLLSWRVHMLPYVDEQSLYNQFHLDEPWDSEHNRKLIEKMPDVFGFPGSEAAAEGKTVYQVPVGPDTIFPGGRGMALKNIIDGLSYTILMVEVDEQHAVEWTKPADWPYDPADPRRGLGGHLSGGFLYLSADGAAGFLSDEVEGALIQKLITPTGKEPIKFQ